MMLVSCSGAGGLRLNDVGFLWWAGGLRLNDVAFFRVVSYIH